MITTVDITAQSNTAEGFLLPVFKNKSPGLSTVPHAMVWVQDPITIAASVTTSVAIAAVVDATVATSGRPSVTCHHVFRHIGMYH